MQTAMINHLRLVCKHPNAALALSSMGLNSMNLLLGTIVHSYFELPFSTLIEQITSHVMSMPANGHILKKVKCMC